MLNILGWYLWKQNKNRIIWHDEKMLDNVRYVS